MWISQESDQCLIDLIARWVIFHFFLLSANFFQEYHQNVKQFGP